MTKRNKETLLWLLGGIFIGIGVSVTSTILFSRMRFVDVDVCGEAAVVAVTPPSSCVVLRSVHSDGGLDWSSENYLTPPATPSVSRGEVCAWIGGCRVFPDRKSFPEGSEHSIYYHFNDANYVVQEALVDFYSQFPTGGKFLDFGGGYAAGKKWAGLYEFHTLDAADRNVSNEDIKFVMCDLHNCTSVADGTYDVIFVQSVFEHVADPAVAVREISRMLRPGGIVINLCFFATRWHPAGIFGDHYRYTTNSFMHLHEKHGGLVTLDAGYDIKGRRHPNLSSQRRNGLKHDWAPSDGAGAWMEFWQLFYVARKPVTPNRACGCEYCNWKRGGPGLSAFEVPHKYSAQPKPTAV